MKASLSDKIGEKLLKHSTTRKWGRKLSSDFSGIQLGDDLLDGDLREDMEWQQCLVNALLGYLDTVQSALDELVKAHQSLIGAGVDQIGGAASVTKTLVTCTVKAQNKICHEVAKHVDLLKNFRASLASCASEVQESDRLASEYRRYSKKVVGLADEDYERRESGEVSKKFDAKLTRNKGKLDSAAKTSSDAHLRAVNALNSCKKSRGLVTDLATRIVHGGSSALAVLAAGAKDSTPRSAAGGNGTARVRASSHDSTTNYPVSLSPFDGPSSTQHEASSTASAGRASPRGDSTSSYPVNFSPFDESGSTSHEASSTAPVARASSRGDSASNYPENMSPFASPRDDPNSNYPAHFSPTAREIISTAPIARASSRGDSTSNYPEKMSPFASPRDVPTPSYPANFSPFDGSGSTAREASFTASAARASPRDAVDKTTKSARAYPANLSPFEGRDFGTLSVAELRRELAQRGLSADGCIEKSDLLARLAASTRDSTGRDQTPSGGASNPWQGTSPASNPFHTDASPKSEAHHAFTPQSASSATSGYVWPADPFASMDTTHKRDANAFSDGQPSWPPFTQSPTFSHAGDGKAFSDGQHSWPPYTQSPGFSQHGRVG